MIRHWISWRIVALAAAAALAASLPAACQGQTGALETLARELAQGIAAKRPGPCVVLIANFDVKKPLRVPLQVRQTLTDEFASDMTRAAPQLSLLEGKPLDAVLNEHGLLAIDQYILPSVVARYVGADLVVSGILIARRQDMELRLTAFDLARNKKIATAKTTLPVSPDWATQPDALIIDPRTGIYLASSPGLIHPRCLACPHPNITGEALPKKTEGSVFILATVDANGRVADAVPLNNLASGLALQAVKKILTWKLNPARTRDGKAVPSRVVIEVDFHLFR